MMKTAIYARESLDDHNRAPPIENQIERGKQWAKENNHTITSIYKDNGYSGGDWNRPDWQQSIKDAKRHTYQTLWIWNQDRLARDTEQFLWYYRMMEEAKVKIWEDTSHDYIDMNTLGGRVKHQSIAQANEIFRLVTSDKVKQAYKRKKAKGERWGRKAKKFDHKLAAELRDRGMGWRKIALECGVSYQTIRRYLIGLLRNRREETAAIDDKKTRGIK